MTKNVFKKLAGDKREVKGKQTSLFFLWVGQLSSVKMSANARKSVLIENSESSEKCIVLAFLLGQDSLLK